MIKRRQITIVSRSYTFTKHQVNSSERCLFKNVPGMGMVQLHTKPISMKSLNEYIDQYRKQLVKGDIRQAYQGLMGYIMELRTHFQNKYPDYAVSGSINQGHMDVTYFSLSPGSLRHKKLKVVILFFHDKISFEVWLAGSNKQIQAKYWELFRKNQWNKYRMPTTTKGSYSIVEHDLVTVPDFDDPDSLTAHIEQGTLEFIKDVEIFLSERSN